MTRYWTGKRQGKRQEHLEELKKKYRWEDRAYVIRILERAAKYAWAYLEGYPIYWHIIRKECNPDAREPEEYILIIRVWLPIDYLTEEEMKAKVEEMAEKMDVISSQKRGDLRDTEGE